ncbi:unnamed protein product [Aphanomyces euteiches]
MTLTLTPSLILSYVKLHLLKLKTLGKRRRNYLTVHILNEKCHNCIHKLYPRCSLMLKT